jgi:tRNA-2-methylthio-N6-dimethylallyladenosine synthase
MKYRIVTFGCQMNEADSEVMASLLDHAGWQATSASEAADLVVINTCSVREKPEHKVNSLLGELRIEKETRPELLLVVTGCMAQREGRALVKRSRWVDAVLGTRCFHRIVEVVDRARAGEHGLVIADLADDPAKVRCEPEAQQRAAPLRAFVPIILGCTNFCSYCIVPHVRGAETSRPRDEILREVEALAARGTREVTLLGQNVLAWGRDLPGAGPGQEQVARGDQGSVRTPDERERGMFAELLRAVGDVDQLLRVRFLTCHPRDVTEDLIDAVADLPKVCEHLHLPIQAGTDGLLREMNRGYTVDQYRKIVDRLRARVPGIAITTDIMVGFPGETDEDFARSMEVYEGIRFDAAFMFAYSPRPGTEAAKRGDQVPRATIVKRLNHLIEVQNGITVERNREEVGAVAEVLVEGPAERGEGLMAGKTRTNKQVVFPGERSLAGALVRVRQTEAQLWGFRGEQQ